MSGQALQIVQKEILEMNPDGRVQTYFACTRAGHEQPLSPWEQLRLWLLQLSKKLIFLFSYGIIVTNITSVIATRVVFRQQAS